MALNDLMVRQAKPKEKKYALSDGRGLMVRPNGQKYWIVRAWKDGKERRRHIRKYPEMSLKDTRAQASDAREQALDATADEPSANVTFGEIAGEWLSKSMGDKKESHVRTIRFRLNKYILPEMKDTPIAEITSGGVLRLCRQIEEQGAVETARRVRIIIGQVGVPLCYRHRSS